MAALMLILKVVLMMVQRVVPLMMSDSFIAVSTLFFSFLGASVPKGEKEVEFYFLVGFRVSHKSLILCLFVLIDLCTRLPDLVLCWTSLWYFVVLCGQALIYAW
jgi:hypothetical protein